MMFNNTYLYIKDDYVRVLDIIKNNSIILDKIVIDKQNMVLKTSFNNEKFITYIFFQDSIHPIANHEYLSTYNHSNKLNISCKKFNNCALM